MNFEQAFDVTFTVCATNHLRGLTDTNLRKRGMKTVNKLKVGLTICIAAFAMRAAAQTVTTAVGINGVNTPTQYGTLSLGASAGYGWMQSFNGLPLVINSLGNGVGIGTTTPDQALTVNGNIDIPAFNTNTNAVIGVADATSSAYVSTQRGGLLLQASSAYGTLQSMGGGSVTIHAGNSYSASQGLEGDIILQSGVNLDNVTTSSYVSLGSRSNEVMRATSSGYVGIGTPSPGATLEVNGTIKIDTTGTNGLTFSGAPGTQTTPWTSVLCGGDYAESVDVTGNRMHYEPGDLLVIDPSAPGKFLKSAEAYSTLVAGIYSTKPGAVGRRQSAAKSVDEVPMAMIGIVPTKVSAENGPIKTGDLLVTSSTVGYAMKGTDRERMLGAVIGKALGRLESGTGVVEVVVTLQ
jgi:hypothetical protein